MVIKKFKIPKIVRLPGVTIQVRVCSPKHMTEDVDGEFCYDEKAEPIIKISSEVSARRQRYLLYHELHHAIVDTLHVALQDNWKEVGP